MAVAIASEFPSSLNLLITEDALLSVFRRSSITLSAHTETTARSKSVAILTFLRARRLAKGNLQSHHISFILYYWVSPTGDNILHASKQ